MGTPCPALEAHGPPQRCTEKGQYLVPCDGRWSMAFSPGTLRMARGGTRPCSGFRCLSLTCPFSTIHEIMPSAPMQVEFMEISIGAVTGMGAALP